MPISEVQALAAVARFHREAGPVAQFEAGAGCRHVNELAKKPTCPLNLAAARCDQRDISANPAPTDAGKGIRVFTLPARLSNRFSKDLRWGHL
jgi:hypothetical protein